jgi:excisionase family DNA binding protein
MPRTKGVVELKRPEVEREAATSNREFTSVKEAAERYTVAESTVWRLLGAKKIRRYKFGGRTLVSLAELRALVQAEVL